VGPRSSGKVASGSLTPPCRLREGVDGEKREMASAGLEPARMARRRFRPTVMMEMRLTREFLPSRPLYKQWTLILKEFGKLLDEYNSSDEVAYWYGERALTGLLAAAAWRIKDGWSIEEFTGLRRTGERQNSGKGDVWIGIQRKTFTVEAKNGMSSRSSSYRYQRCSKEARRSR